MVRLQFVPDPQERFLLALGKDGKADYLLTIEIKLLVIKKFGKSVRLIRLTVPSALVELPTLKWLPVCIRVNVEKVLK